MSRIGSYPPDSIGSKTASEDTADLRNDGGELSQEGGGAAGGEAFSGFGQRQSREDRFRGRAGAETRARHGQQQGSAEQELHKNLAYQSDDFHRRLMRAGGSGSDAPLPSPERADAPEAALDDEALAETEDERVLATNAPIASTMPLFTAFQPPEAVVPTADVSARLRETLETIATRVEQTLRAEFRVTPGGLHNISIDLGGMINGINAVTVRMSATTLDVVLSGGADMLAEDAIQAARALADRLSRRFGNRTVRILAAGQGDSADEEPRETSAVPGAASRPRDHSA